MSQENVEIVRGVRTPVAVSTESRRRTLDERILVRFPGLVRVSVTAWSRLPPRSRMRRAWTSRIIRQGCEAANRRDWDLLLLFFDPEIELHIGGRMSGFVPPDLLGVQRGHKGYLRVWEALIEAYEDARLEHEEVIDFGDRLLAAGRLRGHGTFSGISLDEPLFSVFTLRRGLVIRQDDFVEHDEALEAAGLRDSPGRPGSCHLRAKSSHPAEDGRHGLLPEGEFSTGVRPEPFSRPASAPCSS